MRYPKFLKENGTIGFVAPSFGCNIEPYKTAFQNAQKKFTQMGYGLELGPNCYKGDGIGISSTPENCGKELTDSYVSEKNDILLSCGGGELMCEILDYVDWEAIKNANPKWYMGYSDNTNMTFLLATMCDVAAIYGPCAPAFGMEPWHQSLKDAISVLTGKQKCFSGYDLWEKDSLKNEEQPLLPYNVTEKSEVKCFVPDDFFQTKVKLVAPKDQPIVAKGRLLGGCMDCLVNLLGTKYDNVEAFHEKYKEDGIIWFLESCELNVMSIRRAMWQMEHAGWFKYVKAFVIGRPLCFGEEAFGMDQYNAVCGAIEQHHVPVYMDVDLGHLAPMLPIVCGSMAEVSFDDGKFELHMEFV